MITALLIIVATWFAVSLVFSLSVGLMASRPAPELWWDRHDPLSDQDTGQQKPV